MTALSPPAVTALCAIATHERLYFFALDNAYRAALGSNEAYPPEGVRELVRLGYAREESVHVRYADHSVVLTESGTARLMAGHARGAA